MDPAKLPIRPLGEQSDELVAHFARAGQDTAYLRFHARRYALLMQLAERLVGSVREERSARQVAVLDVGAFIQTQLMAERLDGVVVETLGFAGHPAAGAHTQLDLNELVDPGAMPEIGPYELIVLGEVIEHLYTAPELVLEALAGRLSPGGRLIIQTPNAIALEKRIKLLLGRHPYDWILPGRENHFREYTVAELAHAGRRAGLEPEGWIVRNYFDYEGLARRKRVVYDAICRIRPDSLADGITIWFRRS